MNETVEDSTSLKISSICLPEKWSGEKENGTAWQFEYVMFAGWGGPDQRLKMAPWTFSWDSRNWADINETSKVLAFSLENYAICRVCNIICGHF